MSKRVNLFFLVPSTQLGGCTSFTVHLYKSFEKLGYEPVLWRIGKAPEPRASSFPYGIQLWTCSQEHAYEIARAETSIIVYCFWNKCGDQAIPLIELGVPMVVHDPAEFHDDELNLMRRLRYRPLVIRKANVVGLAERDIDALYLPHPFMPTAPPRIPKIMHGLALARIDFRKRTHYIIEANETLAKEGKAVHLYGEMNRIYEFHQLRQLHPDWRKWYHGEFPDKFGQATRMFAGARFAVDLTQIAGDGGGTQYTFFEAWNAGVPLVLNSAWATGQEDEVRDGDSCVMVQNAAELVEVLRRPVDSFAHVVEGGRRIMEAHSPEVVKLYLEVMNAPR